MQASNTTSIASISGRHGVPKAGPDIEKALDPVLVFIRGTTKLFEFVDRRYFEQVSQPDMQVGCILGFG